VGGRLAILYKKKLDKAVQKVSEKGLRLQSLVDFKTNREVVLAAVKQNGLALGFATAELRVDKGLVLAAVVQNGLALEFATAELQANNRVVLAAVKQNGLALGFATAELQADQEMLQLTASSGVV